MNELALFAGAGGGILGGKLLGWRPVCAVEQDPYAISILLARQNDKLLNPFPIWDDVTTFDGSVWKGSVDVVSGGFPCQDISSAGKGAGITGERSGLWKEMHRIIREVEAPYVFIENSPLLRTRGLQTVLEDLTTSGYDCAWGCFSAKEEGAKHKRNRMWIVGKHTNSSNACGENRTKREDVCIDEWKTKENIEIWSNRVDELESRDVVQRFPSYTEALRMVYGMADRSHRLKALGNGQVPRVAARAFTELQRCLIANN
jgi:DNA (cytosine-5)-methyltransferase 1